MFTVISYFLFYRCHCYCLVPNVPDFFVYALLSFHLTLVSSSYSTATFLWGYSDAKHVSETLTQDNAENLR